MSTLYDDSVMSPETDCVGLVEYALIRVALRATKAATLPFCLALCRQTPYEQVIAEAVLTAMKCLPQTVSFFLYLIWMLRMLSTDLRTTV